MARTAANSGSNNLNKNVVFASAPPFTYACWWSPSLVSADAALITTTGTSNDNNCFDLGFQTSGKKFWAESIASTTSSQGLDGTGGIVAFTWYHAAAVFTSTTSRTAYQNGVAGTANTTSSSPTSLSQIYICRKTSGSNAHGTIAFPAIWTVALSATDILTLSKGAHPRLVRPDKLVSCSNISGGYSPDIDLCDSNTWTVNGTIPDDLNPRIYIR